MDTDTDTTAVYRDTRGRVTELLRAADPGAADLRVGACPRWTVREVAAHLTGVCDDILSGRLDGVATDGWTHAQVDRRAAASLAEILDEWDDVGPKVEGLFGPGGAPPQMVFDGVTHEHDIRGALDNRDARDSAAVTVGLGFAVGAVGDSLRESECPALRIRSGGEEWVVGGDDPAGTLTAERFALLRSMSGRRTAAQISSLDWGGADPAPWLPAFTFGPVTVPLEPTEV
jgi:uncharacterized protein (TIGR03083 family)